MTKLFRGLLRLDLLTLSSILVLTVFPALSATIADNRATDREVAQRANPVGCGDCAPGELLAQGRGKGQGSQHKMSGHRMDWAGAAQELGVTEAELREALGVPDFEDSEEEQGDWSRDDREEEDDQDHRGHGQGQGQGRGQGQGQNHGQGQGQGHGQGQGRGQGQGHGQNRGQGQESDHSGGHHANLAAAAETLGVSETALKDALWNNRQFPRLEAAATQLGISLETLQAALGMPQTRPESREEMEAIHQQRPTLAEAASTLGISEAELREALGVPEGMEPGEHRGGSDRGGSDRNGSDRGNQGQGRGSSRR